MYTVSAYTRMRACLTYRFELCQDVAVQRISTLTGVHDDIVDKALYVWFCQERQRGTPISNSLLKEKALSFHVKMHRGSTTDYISANNDWLASFKSRHGILVLSIVGEKSASEGEVGQYKDNIRTMMAEEDLVLDQVYNADETGLYWKMLPGKSLAGPQETEACGFKKIKDCITLQICTNASGTHKLALLAIGKAAKPRCFKGIEKDSLPVQYTNNKSAWMTANIFTHWFQGEFVPQVRSQLNSRGLPSKAILILDNASCHPKTLSSDDGIVRCEFLPVNTTSLLQPMDQGILEMAKHNYCK